MATSVLRPQQPGPSLPPARPAPLSSPSPSSHPAHPTPSLSQQPEPPSSDPGVDVGVLKELARTGLVEALNNVPGSKTLVLDPTLAGPLGLVTEVSLLKQHGVDKMFWLEPGPLSAQTNAVVYLCRPQIRWMKTIADQIKRHAQSSERHSYHLLLVPRRTTLCEKILEEEGVLGDLTMGALKLEFIPLEEDVLSLEMDGVFREVFLDGDHTSLYTSASALMTLQSAFGLFPRLLGKGSASRCLTTLLQRMRQSALAEDPTNPMLSLPSTVLDCLVVLDRGVDLVTPMLTQLTYQGLVDELIGIKNSYVEVDPSLLSSNPQPPTSSPQNPPTTLGAPSSSTAKQQPKKKHLLLALSDPVLAQLRDLNFSVVGAELNRLAKRLNEDYEGRHRAQTVDQLREFVGRLGGMREEHMSLRLHTGLSEQIVPLTQTEVFNKSLEIQQNLLAGYDISTQYTAIDNLIALSAPLSTVLRLLVLFSITQNGIKPKQLESTKRELLQTYSYTHLPLLLNLEKLGVLCKAPAPGPHLPLQSLRKHLRLLVDDVDEHHPGDIAYVYSGYAPLSVRLVQCVTMKPAVLAAEMGEKPAPSPSPSSSALAGGAEGVEGKLAEGVQGVRQRAHPIVGWKGFEEVVRSVPGEVVDEVQRAEGEQQGRVDLLPKGHSTTTVVFFIGGCTYTEIAALRWMGRQTRGRKYLICTTGIISGTSLIDSLEAPAWAPIST